MRSQMMGDPTVLFPVAPIMPARQSSKHLTDHPHQAQAVTLAIPRLKASAARFNLDLGNTECSLAATASPRTCPRE